jgi:hypothetical protein
LLAAILTNPVMIDAYAFRSVSLRPTSGRAHYFRLRPALLFLSPAGANATPSTPDVPKSTEVSKGITCIRRTAPMISVGSPLEIRNSVFGRPQHGRA